MICVWLLSDDFQYKYFCCCWIQAANNFTNGLQDSWILWISLCDMIWLQHTIECSKLREIFRGPGTFVLLTDVLLCRSVVNGKVMTSDAPELTLSIPWREGSSCGFHSPIPTEEMELQELCSSLCPGFKTYPCLSHLLPLRYIPQNWGRQRYSNFPKTTQQVIELGFFHRPFFPQNQTS